MIKNYFDCNSKFVIYTLICDNCDKKYIGECSEVRQRMNLHKSDIKLHQNRKLQVSKHIHNCADGKFKFCIIYQSDSNVLKRRTVEKHFIETYKPSLNPN